MRLTRRKEPNETETRATSQEAGGGREVVESSRPLAGPRREPVESELPASGGRRRKLAWRTRNAGAAAVGTAGAGVLLLARLVMAVASVIALLIALSIVLRDVDANGANTIVKGIHEGANFFAGAFTGLIRFSGHPKRAITVNWGIALLVYLIVGAIVAKVIAGVGRGGLLFERSHRTAPTH
jgi:hypothetical protein